MSNQDKRPENIGREFECKSIEEQLGLIDWSFFKRDRPSAIEAIHPYPAKFIGDIPRALIDTLPLPNGSAILDPFCGSGTTMVEAQRAGIKSVGIDLNPIACLISRVKSLPMPDNFLQVALEVAASADSLNSADLPNIPDIPNVDHWFPPEVQIAINKLTLTISEPIYSKWADQLKLVLSSILVRISNQDSDTRYAAIEKDVGYKDVFVSFNRSASKLHSALQGRDWQLPCAHIIEGNTLEIAADEIPEKIGMIITSPPYPNAYEYWLYHKYRMWWLGFDPIAVKKHEIGARAHFFKKNHHTAETFSHQMKATINLINSVLVDGGYACFVVGRSKIHGKLVDNGNIIEDVAAAVGLKSKFRFERVINAKRKSFNLSHAKIKTESVLVFEKVGS